MIVTALISGDIVIPSYPKRACQHVDAVRIVSQSVTVIWHQCD